MQVSGPNSREELLSRIDTNAILTQILCHMDNGHAQMLNNHSNALRTKIGPIPDTNRIV